MYREPMDKEKTGLENYKTCELVEELKMREGVKTHVAEPYEDVSVRVNGPAIVFVVID